MCSTEQRQVKELFFDRTSNKRTYGISEEYLEAEECVVPNLEDMADETR